MAAATVPVNKYTSTEIIRTCSELLVASQNKDDSESKTAIETKLVAFIQQIGSQITVLDSSKSLPADEPRRPLLVAGLSEEK